MAVYRESMAGQINEWQVTVIDVLDPRFRTADGLGVGSTLAQIRAISPGVQARVGPLGPTVSLRDRGLSCWLDPAAARGETIADSATVTRISVRESPLPLPSVP